MDLTRFRCLSRDRLSFPDRSRASTVVMMTRRARLLRPARDVMLLDGQEPADDKPCVPAHSVATLRLSAADVGRQVAGPFNEERIVARAWSLSDNRIAVIEPAY